MRKTAVILISLVLFLGNINSVFGDDFEKSFIESAKQKMTQNKYKGAIKDLEMVINSSPDNAEAYYLKGVANFHLRRNDKSIENLEIAIALNHRDARFYYYKALSHADQDELKEAFREMNFALEYDKNNIEYLLFRADLEFELKYYTDAIQDWEHAASLGSVDAKDMLEKHALKM